MMLYMSNKTRFDALDRAIITALREDARMSNVELAGRVGLTPAPCLRRVKRLEQRGVIRGYRADIDPSAEGRGMIIIVSVEISATTYDVIEQFEAAIAEFDEVLEARRVFGVPDYFLRVAVADAAEYEQFQMHKLAILPAVNRLVSHQTMKTIKGSD